MRRAKAFFENEKIKLALKPTKKKVIILSAIILVVFGALVFGKGGSRQVTTEISNDYVTRGDIEVTITGSAAVEPYERFEIIPKVSGDITYSPYEVGDAVNKDDILYMFDSSDSDLTVERQRISMQQSENNYKKAMRESEKLALMAENDGIISGLTIKVGEEVKSGTKIASVDDTAVMEVELPFTQAQVANIFVGDSATVTSSKHMSTVLGTVSRVSNSSYAGTDGTTLYRVRIRFNNPGAFYAGMKVGGSVGDNISPGSGTIENNASGVITAETNGIVSKIHYSNGDYVKAGTVIATLTSDDVTEKIAESTLSYKSAKLSMEQTEKSLEDYNITSPINGTVITKDAKAGDTIDKTNSAKTLMVIADLSRLKFELAIDELDVGKVKEGQEVLITCDAIPDETFKGVITNVSVEGVATNGVTTYSAKVEIPEPGNLRPSMNVDASIIVESARNVLRVPTADITTIGRRSFVFVKGKVENTENNDRKMPEGFTPPEEFEMPEGTSMPEGRTTKKSGGKNNGAMLSMMPEAPEGYTTVEVKTGIANEDFTEIVSGLTEGQEIYSKISTSSTNSMMRAMGAMSGMHGAMGSMPSGMGGMSSGMGARPGGMR